METDKQIRRRSQYLCIYRHKMPKFKIEKLRSQREAYRRQQLNRFRNLKEIIKKDLEKLLQQKMYEAAWCLTNIASGGHAQTMAVVDNGAIPVLAELCLTDNPQLKEQAIWALGIIAGDGIALRNQVINSGVLKYLVDIILSPDCLTNQLPLSLVRNTTWTISNLCRRKPSASFQTLECILPAMKKIILEINDSEMHADAAWTLGYISGCGPEGIDGVIKLGIIPDIVKLAESHVFSISSGALWTLGNISTGNDLQTETIVTAGAIPVLKKLIRSSKKNQRKEACWTLSNLVAGTNAQLQAVIDQQIFPDLLQICVSDPDSIVQREAMWAVCNVTSSGTIEHISYLIDIGCIPVFSLFLDTSQLKRSILIVLEAITNIIMLGGKSNTGKQNEYLKILKENGIKSKLETLRTHSSELVVKKVAALEAKWNSDSNKELL